MSADKKNFLIARNPIWIYPYCATIVSFLIFYPPVSVHPTVQFTFPVILDPVLYGLILNSCTVFTYWYCKIRAILCLYLSLACSYLRSFTITFLFRKFHRYSALIPTIFTLQSSAAWSHPLLEQQMKSKERNEGATNGVEERETY